MNLLKKITLAILIIMGLTFTVDSFAQGTPPPPPGEHGTSGNSESGGGAPIGGGLFILIGLGAVYGGKKLYQIRKENLEE